MPPRESLTPRATRESPICRSSGTERASRSSFGTTRVSWLLWGYKTDVPCLINGRRWSAARVLSRRCATPVVGPGGSAISRNRPRWHRVGLKPGIGSRPLWRRGDVGYVEQAVDRASSRVLAGAGVRLCAGGRAGPASSACVIPLEDEAGAEDETVAQRVNEPLIIKVMQCLADAIETSERAQVVRLDV